MIRNCISMGVFSHVVTMLLTGCGRLPLAIIGWDRQGLHPPTHSATGQSRLGRRGIDPLPEGVPDLA
jgi:hypothetical protein